jgi:hypothetical protein
MKAAEYRNGDDLAVVVVVRRGVRDPLPNTLMRPGFVEVEHVLARGSLPSPTQRHLEGEAWDKVDDVVIDLGQWIGV